MSNYVWFEGIPLPNLNIKKRRLEEICHKFVIGDEDIIIETYPKSGTHWLIEIVCLIQTKGNPEWVQSVPIWERSPWIESEKGYQALINKEGPHVISSHLPFHIFPKSFFNSKAKMIYAIRNPRDILVSGYFYWSKTKFSKNPDSLATYFEWFLNGYVAYGSWFEHTCGWLSMKERENFLLLSYEDMRKVTATLTATMHLSPTYSMQYHTFLQVSIPPILSGLTREEFLKDTRRTIEKICDFLGKKLEPDELEMVLKYSSFQAMKENKMSNYSLVTENFFLMILSS